VSGRCGSGNGCGCFSLLSWGGGGFDLPVALATALLLGLGRRLAGVSGFAEVFREIGFGNGGAVGETGVVAVGGLVGAGHCVLLVRALAGVDGRSGPLELVC
jgi:hypothetical protein